MNAETNKIRNNEKFHTACKFTIKYLADRLKFFGLWMIHFLGHERYLFLSFFAHFVFGSFQLFVVILYVY
jgi:hypothetical protein